MFENIPNIITLDISGVFVQVFFFVTIILMIKDNQKPPVTTSLMTGTALIVLGLGGSFNSPLVMWLGVLNGFLWLVIGWQRYNQKPIVIEVEKD